MSNLKVQITITEQQLRAVAKSCSSIDSIMQVLREDYSDYAEKPENKTSLLSFAVEFVKILASIAPDHTSAFVKTAEGTLNTKALRMSLTEKLTQSGVIYQRRTTRYSNTFTRRRKVGCDCCDGGVHKSRGKGTGRPYAKKSKGFLSSQRAYGYTATFVRG
jgi:hypothetical protein